MTRCSSLALVVSCAFFVVGCGRCDYPLGSAYPPDAIFPDAGAAADGGPMWCSLRCGAFLECCTEGQECIEGACLDSCANNRCGDDLSVCCAAGELCVGGACTAPGAPCTSDAGCGPDEICELLVGRCLPIPDDAECRYQATPGVFEPELEWSWWDATSGTTPGHAPGVTSFPVVAQLDDDDVPDVAFVADGPQRDPSMDPFLEYQPLVAVSGADGSEHWRTAHGVDFCSGGSPAAGDLDGDGRVEILAIGGRPAVPYWEGDTWIGASGCGFVVRHFPGGASELIGLNSRLIAVNADGSIKWISAEPVGDPSESTVHSPAIAIADIDEDGLAEVIVHGSIFAHDGTRLLHDDRLAPVSLLFEPNYAPIATDIDPAPGKELLTPSGAYRIEGSRLVPIWEGGPIARGDIALGRFIASRPGPQLVVRDTGRLAILDARTGAVLFGPITLDGPNRYSAFAPSVGNFDGDPSDGAEIGIGSGDSYVVIDPRLPAPHELWRVTANPAWGRVSGTVFDFDGDGAVEAIVASYCHVRVLDGRTGALLWNVSNVVANNQPIPVAADVDRDGNAELLIAGAGYPASSGAGPFEICQASSDLPFVGASAWSGLRAFRDRLDNWVPTRSVWNQASYHIDNVDEIGGIPAVEAPSWDTHNTFRVNRLVDPDAITLAPNLRVIALGAVAVACPERVTLRARVQNDGARGVAAGVPVAFYAGTPSARGPLLGVGHTSRFLLSGELGWTEATVDVPMLDPDLRLPFFAVADDDGTGRGLHSECHEDDNVSEAAFADCRGPI